MGSFRTFRWSTGSRIAAASGLGRNEVRRRAKRAPLAISRGLPGVRRLDDFECIAAEQQAYRRIVHSDDLEDHLGRLGRIAGLFAVVVELEPCRLADGGIVFRADFVDRLGRAGKVGPKAARLKNGHLDAERR